MNETSKEQLQAELELLGSKPLGQADTASKWAAEPGDQLAGQVVEYEPEYAGKWGAVPRLQIAVAVGTEGGSPIKKGELRSLICSPFRLRDFVEAEQPQDGDTVLLFYAGQVPGKSGGKAWHDFRAKLVKRVEPTELEAEDESRQGEETPFLPEDGS